MGAAWHIVKGLFVAYFCFYYSHNGVIGESDSDSDASGSGAVSEEDVQKRYDSICEQLQQFTPKLCDIPASKKNCLKVCPFNQEGMDCGFKEPPIPTKKLKKKKLSKKKKAKGDKAKKSSKGNKRHAGNKRLVGDKRIVGGKESMQGEWPWQVYLVGNITGNATHYKYTSCGGAILSKRFILTAAHCVLGGEPDMTNPVRWKVWVGNHNSDNPFEPFEKAHDVQKIMHHPNFHWDDITGQQFNDVAIFQLKDEIRMEDENKGRICLPDPKSHPVQANDQECYVTGWGKIAEGKEASAILKHARVLTISRAVCNLPMNYNNLIDNTMFCAGHLLGGTDACQGDSGGSLVCSIENRWYTAGIVSWGWGCARANRVGVYTNATYFKEWIVTTILEKADDFA